MNKFVAVLKQLLNESTELNDILINVAEKEPCMDIFYDQSKIAKYGGKICTFPSCHIFLAHTYLIVFQLLFLFLDDGYDSLRDDIIASFKTFSKVRGKRTVAQSFQARLDAALADIIAGGDGKVASREKAKRNLPSTSSEITDYKSAVDWILREISAFAEFEYFLFPVDKSIYPEYYVAIKKPMDMQSIKKKLKNQVYDSVDSLLGDMQLIFDNCKFFNAEGSFIFECASQCEKKLNELVTSKFEPSGELMRTFMDVDADDTASSRSAARKPGRPPSKKSKRADSDDDDGMDNDDMDDDEPEDNSEDEKPRKKASTSTGRGRGRPPAVSNEAKNKETKEVVRHKDVSIMVRCPDNADGVLQLPWNNLRRILRTLSRHPCAEFFVKPLNTKAFPGYNNHIELSTIASKHWQEKDKRPSDICALIVQSFRNAVEFHGGSPIGVQAQTLLDLAESLIAEARSLHASDVEAYKSAAAGEGGQNLDAYRSQQLRLQSQAKEREKLSDIGASMQKILRAMRKQRYVDPFISSDGLEALPDYLSTIREPMDVETIEGQISSYHDDHTEFARDVRLIFSNTMEFNNPGDPVYVYAEELQEWFEKIYARTFPSGRQAAVRPNKGVNPTIESDGKKSAVAKTIPKVEQLPAAPVAPKEKEPKIPNFEKFAKEAGYGKVLGRPATAEQVRVLSADFEGMSPEDAVRDARIQQRAFEVTQKLLTESDNYIIPCVIAPGIYEVKSWGDVAEHPNCYQPETNLIFPNEYESVRSMRLCVVPEKASGGNVSPLDPQGAAYPYVQVEMSSKVSYASRTEPICEVRMHDGTLVAADTDPRAAWVAALGRGADLLRGLGSKLRRCRGVFNRISASPDAAHFREQPQLGAQMAQYEEAVRAPMWLRVIHGRLVGGLYDNEFDFAWDMRLVFSNATKYYPADSEQNAAATRLFELFNTLLADWVLNPQDMGLDDPVKGPWDDWQRIRVFDTTPEGVCLLSQKKASATELLKCSLCEDQFLPASLEVKTSPSAEDFECPRCIRTHDVYPPPLPVGTKVRETAYSREEFGGVSYVPAPDVGPGWYQGRAHRRVQLKKHWLSPLGYEVTAAPPTSEQAYANAISSQMEQDNVLSLILEDERASEYAQLVGKPFTAKPGSPVKEMHSKSKTRSKVSTDARVNSQMEQEEKDEEMDEEESAKAKKSKGKSKAPVVVEEMSDENKILCGALCNYTLPKGSTTAFFCNKDELNKSAFLSVGDRVQGLWRNGSAWFLGTLKGVNADGTYYIHYDDGDEEKRVPLSRLRLTSNVGAIATKINFGDFGPDSMPVSKMADYAMVTPESLPATGFFGLHLREIKMRLECLAKIDAVKPILSFVQYDKSGAEVPFKPYLFTNSTLVYQETMLEIQHAETVSKTLQAADSKLLDLMYTERIYWSKKREEAEAAAAKEKNVVDVIEPDPTFPTPVDTNSVRLDPLFPGVPPENGELLLVLWDFLDLARPVFGEGCFSFKEIMESLTPPAGKFSSVRQMAFDQVCCMMSHLLLKETASILRHRMVEAGLSPNLGDDRAGNMSQDLFFYRPLNVLTWPLVARCTFLVTVAPISFSDGMNAARFIPMGSAVLTADIIVLLLAHPYSQAFHGAGYGESIPTPTFDVSESGQLINESSPYFLSDHPAADLLTVRNRCIHTPFLPEGRFYQDVEEMVSDCVHAILQRTRILSGLKAPEATYSRALIDHLKGVLLRMEIKLDFDAIIATAQARISSYKIDNSSETSVALSPVTLGLVTTTKLNVLTIPAIRVHPKVGWDFQKPITPTERAAIDALPTNSVDVQEEIGLLSALESTLRLLRTTDPERFDKDERLSIYKTLLQFSLRAGVVQECIVAPMANDEPNNDPSKPSSEPSRSTKESVIEDIGVDSAIPGLVLEPYKITRGSTVKCHFTGLKAEFFPLPIDPSTDTEASNVALVNKAEGTQTGMGHGLTWVVVPEWLLSPPVMGGPPSNLNSTPATVLEPERLDDDAMDEDDSGAGQKRSSRAKAQISYSGTGASKKRSHTVALEIVVQRLAAARLTAMQEDTADSDTFKDMHGFITGNDSTTPPQALIRQYQITGVSDRTRAVGTCLCGWSYWVLAVQERNSLFSNGSSACMHFHNKRAECRIHEPAVLIHVPQLNRSGARSTVQAGWYTVQCGSDSTQVGGLLAAILAQPSDHSRTLHNNIIMRLALTLKCNWTQGFKRVRSMPMEFHVRRELLEKQLDLEEEYEARTGCNGTLALMESTNKMEMKWAKCAEVRCLSLLAQLHKDEEQNNDKNPRVKESADLVRMARIHKDRVVDTLDMHPMKGYLRPDLIAKVCQFHPSLTASRMQFEPHLCQWIREVDKRRIFKTGSDVSCSMKSILPPSALLGAESAHAAQCYSLSSRLILPLAEEATFASGAMEISPPVEMVKNIVAPVPEKRAREEVNDGPSKRIKSDPDAPAAADSIPQVNVLVIPGITAEQFSEYLQQSRARGHAGTVPEEVKASQPPITEVWGLDANGERHMYRKPVEMLHLITEEPLRLFETQAHAATFLGIAQGGISQCCTGAKNDSNGFKFRFYRGPVLDIKNAAETRVIITQDEAKALANPLTRDQPISTTTCMSASVYEAYSQYVKLLREESLQRLHSGQALSSTLSTIIKAPTFSTGQTSVMVTYSSAPLNPRTPRTLMDEELSLVLAGKKPPLIPKHPWVGLDFSSLHSVKLTNHFNFMKPQMAVTTVEIPLRLAKLKADLLSLIYAIPEKMWQWEENFGHALIETCSQVSEIVWY